MSSKEVTIYDIAEQLNIAPSTVSRGLKGHFSVSVKTREKIRSAAEAMGYRSNTFAVNLRRQRTNTIGVIVPRLNSYFMAEVIAGIEKITNEAGFNLIIGQSLEHTEKEILNVKTMFNSRVDGLLVSLSGSTNDIRHYHLFLERKIPVLFFDRVPTAGSVPSVMINNAEAGYLVTKHLIEQGAKRLVHVSGSQAINVYAERFKGFMRALNEYRIPFHEGCLLVNNLSEDAGIVSAHQVKALQADAVFLANDNCAASCMNELKRLGYRIPADIAIAGFNNDMISRNVEPALTTVNYPAFKMGELAARNLLDRLEHKLSLEAAESIVLKSELLIRASSIRK